MISNAVPKNNYHNRRLFPNNFKPNGLENSYDKFRSPVTPEISNKKVITDSYGFDKNTPTRSEIFIPNARLFKPKAQKNCIATSTTSLERVSRSGQIAIGSSSATLEKKYDLPRNDGYSSPNDVHHQVTDKEDDKFQFQNGNVCLVEAARPPTWESKDMDLKNEAAVEANNDGEIYSNHNETSFKTSENSKKVSWEDFRRTEIRGCSDMDTAIKVASPNMAELTEDDSSTKINNSEVSEATALENLQQKLTSFQEKSKQFMNSDKESDKLWAKLTSYSQYNPKPNIFCASKADGERNMESYDNNKLQSTNIGVLPKFTRKYSLRNARPKQQKYDPKLLLYREYNQIE